MSSNRGRRSERQLPFNASVPGYDPYQGDFVNPLLNNSWHPGMMQQHPSRTQRNTPRMYSAPPAQAVAQPSPRVQPVSISVESDPEPTPAQLFALFRDLQDEISELKGENMSLKQVINIQAAKLSRLELRTDELDQYGRRENVCFTNLKVDTDHPCDRQVIELCNELGVEVAMEDLVTAHPLPAKRGKPQRCIARFHNRSKAHEVLAARKNSKNIAPAKKAQLAAKADRGFAIQPNITPDRAKLLGQLKEASEKCGWHAHWVDFKNCNLMLKLSPDGRPVPIRCTHDILKHSGEQYTTNDMIFCSNEVFRVFDVSFGENAGN